MIEINNSRQGKIGMILRGAEAQIQNIVGCRVSVHYTINPIKNREAASEIEKVILQCCDIFQYSFEEIFNSAKTRNTPTMRQAISYVIKHRFPTMSAYGFGKIFRCDHTSFLSRITKANTYIESNDALFLFYFNQIKHLMYEGS